MGRQYRARRPASVVDEARCAYHLLSQCSSTDTLIGHLNGASKESLPTRSVPPGDHPLFVTWKKRDGNGNHHLRGCIGTFTPIKLAKGLQQYALTSALKDTRFAPIGTAEVALLHCSVSILMEFEAADDCFDWAIGKHGIQIEFVDPVGGGKRNGTYLPEVAREQGWDQEECINSLVRKAGYKGTVTDKLRRDLVVTRYRSEKSAMSYDEYRLLTTSLPIA